MGTILWVIVIVVGGAFLGWAVATVMTRWAHSEPIRPIRRSKKPVIESVKVDPKFVDSIRWKGEIYCADCGSLLTRVPISRDWYKAPSYEPMTGRKLTDIERFGEDGLMVCAAYEKDRLRIPFATSFQEHFRDKSHPTHGMYYTDQPALAA